LRSAALPGGDAAARCPVQAAAGFLTCHPEVSKGPFNFPRRFRDACELIERNVRVFPTTSMGRLFDAAAALLGFTREITFEAQAAMWLEYLARCSAPVRAYPFPFENGELDYRPLLEAIISDRLRGRDVRECARAFHGAVATAILAVVEAHAYAHVVVSGGVFQNLLLMETLREALGERLWCNRITPANDGGIALGQAAIAAFTQ
jgi:hydrogenase maturation protein HypF